MPDASLVVVGTFLNAFDADLARSALEADGIAVLVRSDDCGGLRPHLWMHGVEVLVRDEDQARALEILTTVLPPQAVKEPREV